MQEDPQQQPAKGAPRGPASFCIPRAAIEALVRAQASAQEIVAYLTLAKFTDATGVYTTSSVKAVKDRAGMGGPPAKAALERLAKIRAVKITSVHNGRSGKSGGWIDQAEDRGPILYSREAWLAAHPGEQLPDGPFEKAMVRYVLPDFGEPAEDRVWIGAGLVEGVGKFTRPLFHLKNAGPVAARLLLELYSLNDMETWGGVNPLLGPWRRYEPAEDEKHGIGLPGGARLIRARPVSLTAKIDANVSGNDKDAYWQALRALESIGLIYEMVTVLNRNPKPAKLSTGEAFGDIDQDAEPLYELDCRSHHGFKPAGEEGLAGMTARTAGDFKRPVTAREYASDGTLVGSGTFDGTYAAIVPAGSGAMVAGIYRLRFRPTNPKNAGVTDAWSRIRSGNRTMAEFITEFREFNGLPAIPAPWGAAAAAKAKKAEAPGPKPADPIPF